MEVMVFWTSGVEDLVKNFFLCKRVYPRQFMSEKKVQERERGGHFLKL